MAIRKTAAFIPTVARFEGRSRIARSRPQLRRQVAIASARPSALRATAKSIASSPCGEKIGGRSRLGVKQA